MAHTRTDIDALLTRSDLAVERAIIVLFKLQTADEQRSSTTQHHNDKGFSMTDALVGTRFARFLLGMNDNNEVKFPPKSLKDPIADRIFKRYGKRHGSVLGRARAIALKHSRQLVDVANGDLEVN